MRRNYSWRLLPLAVIIVAVACQREELDVQISERTQDAEIKEVIVTAQLADAIDNTRTSTSNDGTVYWSTDDKIKIFSAGQGAMFSNTEEQPTVLARFVGSIPVITGSDDGEEKDYVWGLYPYREDATYSEPDGISRTAVITTTLNDLQVAKEGTYADNQTVTIGRALSLSIPFKSAYTGFYVTFQNRDDIISVTFKGRSGEALAGRMTVGLDEETLTPVVRSLEDPKTEVTLKAPQGRPFSTGQRYYLIMLPDVTLTEGFSITARTASGLEGTYTVNAPGFKMKRNVINYVANLDTKITDWHTATTQGLNEIWYTTTNGAITYTSDGTTGNEVIASGFVRTDQGIMRRLLFSGPVTKIDANAFKGTDLTSIMLPEGVTTIGEAAFMNCSYLTEIIIPDNVTTIEDDAFHYCTSLNDIVFGRGLKSIGKRSFYDVNVTDIYIPDGVESIGDQAFAVCPELQFVRLPESLTTIGSGVFEDSSYIERFEGAFAADSRHLIDGDRLLAFAAGEIGDNYVETVPDGVRVIDHGVYAGSTFVGVNLPEGLEEIGPSAFARCFHLKNITIPSSVKRIYEWAFEECEGLEWVKIKRTESIIQAALSKGSDWYAFDATEDCPIYVSSEALYWYTYGQHWNEYGQKLGVNNRYKLTPADNEILYTTTDGAAVTLPSSIASTVEVIAPEDNGGTGVIRASSDWTTIPYGMFNSLDNSGTANLKSISIPDKVTTIEREAFFFCENLEDVTFGTGVRTIDHNAFFNCGLLTLVLPENIQLLRGSPFGANSSLTTVELPELVEIFGGNPFMNCEGLIKFTGNHPYISEDGKCLISPEGKLISYACASTTDEFELPENVTELGDYAFAYASCAGIIINSLEPPTLGSHVFDGNNCYVSVPDATYSDYQVADGWSALASAGRLRYHQSVRSIWYTTTDGVKLDDPTALPTGCTLVRNVYLSGKGMMVFSDTVLDIPEKMIHSNTRLLTLSLPDKVEVVGKSAFSHCIYLESVSLGNNLKELDDLALYMTNIATLSLPQSLKKIGNQALGGTKLVSISIPESVTTFGDMPFYQSYKLESFTGNNPHISSDHHCLIVDGTLIAFTPAGVSGSYQVPSGVTSIGQYAMMRSLFTSLSFPASLQSIGISALRYCESLKTVEIPTTVTSIGAYGFSDCLALESVKMMGGTPPKLGNNAFWNMPDGCKIYIPWSGSSAYATANNWSALTDHFQGY